MFENCITGTGGMFKEDNNINLILSVLYTYTRGTNRNTLIHLFDLHVQISGILKSVRYEAIEHTQLAPTHLACFFS